MKANRRTKRTARQLCRLCAIDGRLDATRIRIVTTHLAGSTRRDALATLTVFGRLVRLDRDRHAAIVESAVALDPAGREALTRELARAYGSDIDLSFTENSALIAGVRIRVGSDVYDGSIRARLAALEARL